MSRPRLYWWWLGGAVALVLLLAALVRVGGDPEVRVVTSEVTAGTIARDVLTTGTLTPAKLVDVGTQVSGTIQALDADFNASVRAGQVIARLDPSSLDADVTRASAALAESQADASRLRVLVEDARTKLARAEALAADDLITRNDLDTARVAFQQAASDLKGQEAEQAAAAAMLRQARVTRAHTVIRSPIDGIVVNRLVEVGQTVAASVESPVLFTIADLRHMQLLAEVNETEVGGVQRGSRASFEIESLGNRRFEGTVGQVRIQPIVEQPAATSGTSSPPSSSTAAGSASSGAARGSAPAPPAAATPSSSRSAATSNSPSPSQPAAQTPSTAGTPPAGSVVSYTAVIDVQNVDGALSPGSTAVVTLPGSRRERAVRIPNNAVTFRPAADLLNALDQEEPPPDHQQPERTSAPGRAARVWKFEGGKFVAIPVRLGIADDTWTELLSGDVQPGDRLVTSAALDGR